MQSYLWDPEIFQELKSEVLQWCIDIFFFFPEMGSPYVAPDDFELVIL